MHVTDIMRFHMKLQARSSEVPCIASFLTYSGTYPER